MNAPAAAPDYGYAVSGHPVPPIPWDKGLAGPVTASRWRRSALLYGLLLALGTALAWSADPRAASFGLGLVLPGGGFLFHATGALASTALHVGLFLGTLLLFVAALFLWVATGNILAPIAVWLGSALGAALMDHWAAGFIPMGALCRAGVATLALHAGDARLWLPALASLLAVTAAWALRRRRPWLAAERARINRYLEKARTTVTSGLDPVSGLPQVQPVSDRDLELWRFLLDRALQPVPEFNGFDRIDEFREAAKRYQICNMSYMLGMHAYVRTPAFRGYQARAQQQLGLKMMDHRVWSYWRLENVWGNLDANPDPFARDNIMYYGWYGGMLGIDLCVTGDERFNRPGAIRLQHPSGRVYESSFSDICQIIRRNMAGSDFCLFPCEPRWIYPICNNFGALSLKCHDRVYGTHWWDEVRERYQRSLEDEFVTMNGRITAIRDYYTGMTLPALTATMADAVTALFIHPVLPELARRSWEIVRHDLIRVAQGRVELRTNGWDRIDFGNYRRSLLTTYALVAASAREMGDDEVANGLLQRIDAEYPSESVGGVRHYRGASTSAHAVIHAARVLRGNGFRDLVTVGMPPPWRNGPLLDEAAYPQVLVAGAVSDGAALTLDLAPGAGGGRYTLGLAQLRPGQRYRVTGGAEDAVQADGAGRAHLQVDLARRCRVQIAPVA
ncbi:MAG: hypothetical protein E6R07_15085 [Nevskiaceae bacterium]|nr:MAG: hypothetical protein E6R07_15085 [Nevskiaceae bacterium]